MDNELQHALRHARQSSTGWWRGNCPYCEDRLGTPGDSGNLSINVGTGWWMCWRCNAKGRIKDVHTLVEGGHKYAVQAVRAQLQDQERWALPLGFAPLLDAHTRSALAAHNAMEYLEARGVHRRIQEEAALGVTLIGAAESPWWRYRIIVPVYDARGVLRGYVGRTYVRHSLPYLYPRGMRRGEVLFNEAALLVETGEPLYVMEGVFDALPHWPHAVACLGKPTEQHYQLLLKARRPLVIALDRDAEDEAWTLAAHLQLDGVPAVCLRLPATVKDPGELRPPELQRLLAEAG